MYLAGRVLHHVTYFNMTSITPFSLTHGFSSVRQQTYSKVHFIFLCTLPSEVQIKMWTYGCTAMCRNYYRLNATQQHKDSPLVAVHPRCFQLRVKGVQIIVWPVKHQCPCLTISTDFSKSLINISLHSRIYVFKETLKERIQKMSYLSLIHIY